MRCLRSKADSVEPAGTQRKDPGLVDDSRKGTNADCISPDYGSLTELRQAAPEPMGEVERLPATDRGSNAERRLRASGASPLSAAEGQRR